MTPTLTTGILRDIYDKLKEAEASTPINYKCFTCGKEAQAMPGAPVPVCCGACFNHKTARVEGHGPMEAVYHFVLPPECRRAPSILP